jgi:small subunit ribosomal protein S20
MANIKSSKKDLKRSAAAHAVNQSVRTSLKTYIKKVRLAAAKGDDAEIAAALSSANKALDKAAQRGIIHKNQAARRKSRIALVAHAAKKPAA